MQHLHLHIPYPILREANTSSSMLQDVPLDISQLEQFTPRLSHKTVAKEHKKSESYQLTRSLRSAVQSHSSYSYVTCRSGVPVHFRTGASSSTSSSSDYVDRWSCERAGENSDPYWIRRWHFLLLDGFYGMFCGAFVPPYHFSRCTCVQIVRLGLQDELLLLRQFLRTLSRMVS